MGNSIGNLPMLRMPPSGLGAVRSSLNPNDPDYLHKLGLIGAIEGAHELEQANQDIASQERARAQTDLSGPVTTGPVTHALGVPANPETPELTKPRSLLGKIGHGLAEAGNIAGESVFPGQMAMIPGTDLYKRATAERQFQHGLEAERERELEEREAEYAKLGEGGLGVKQQQAATQAANVGSEINTRAAGTQLASEKFDLNKQTEAAREAFQSGQLDLGAQRLGETAKQLAERIRSDQTNEGLKRDAMQLVAQRNGILANALQQKGAEGASKITQQLAKDSSVWNELESLVGFGPLPVEVPMQEKATAPVQQPVQVQPSNKAKQELHSFTYNGQRYIDVPDVLYKKYKGKPGFSE